MALVRHAPSVGDTVKGTSYAFTTHDRFSDRTADDRRHRPGRGRSCDGATTPSINRRRWSHRGEHALLDRAAQQLDEYFDGDRTDFELPLEPAGTPFQKEAWTTLRTIPYGETISYGEQARRLGDKNKSRAVGAANGQNPIPIVVPCHRVVGSNGHLTGFGGGIEVKAWLLDHEFKVRAGQAST